MFIQKITPVQVFQYATTMLISIRYDSSIFSTVTVELEFYDENKNPVHNCNFSINDLPVNTNIPLMSDPNADLFSSDALIMYETHRRLIFDNIKQKYGLTYSSKTYEVDEKLVFSYDKFDYLPSVVDENLALGYDNFADYWHYF